MKVVILGGGSFGTAIAHQLSFNPSNQVTLLMRDTKIASELNRLNTNITYFPNRKVNEAVFATTDYRVISDTDVLFIAVPTKNILEVIFRISPFLQQDTLLVNLTKGLWEDGQTIIETLEARLNHTNIVTLKGASFGAEMIDRNATLLTLGYSHQDQLIKIKTLTNNTNIFLDYTTDIKGVELLSALKNIYAILIGNIDAKFNSANTRFLFLTKAISEIKTLLKALGGREDTIFLSCGMGDIGLTSLNDLSRNRTLGLLIGKGFFTSSSSNNSVVLEGVKTLKLIDTFVPESLQNRLPILNQMKEFFMDSENSVLSLDFEKLFRSKYKTVLTYGTFDLLHFGHLEILRKAKQLGDRLIVGLSTDEFNLSKGKVCEFSFEKRKQFLESLDFVDLVIPERNWEQKEEDVIKNDVDTFVMGGDWEGKFDFLEKHCEVVYFPRTKGVSTTALKALLRE